MHIAIITIFPDFFAETLKISIVGKARATGLLETTVVDLREFGSGVHRQVDDAPFGGGVGMVLQPEPMANALVPYAATRRILLTPAGATLTQVTLDRWALLPALTLVCGRYEGVDERIAENFIDEEVSIGDYVLLGGEVAALAIVEGVTRLLPGALGNPESVHTESFRNGLLEEPQYTRPADWRGWSVPDVLLSGHHERVEEWRQQQRLERTRLRRPDLLRTEFAEPREVE